MNTDKYLPSNKHTKRKLTVMQNSLLDNLETSGYNPLLAAERAGYKHPPSAVSSVRQELIAIAENMVASDSMIAARTLHDVLTSDVPMKNLKEKIDVAKTILDRTGIARKEILDVNQTIKGGVFVLPAKTTSELIEGEFREVSTGDT